jgi:NADPH:quinone reductase-like Zn-dependent oxidoreductase
MSVPHLDTRIIGGHRSLLFGPYAGVSSKFLKHGSLLDLFETVEPSNVDAVLDLVNGQSAIRRDAEIIKSGGSLVSTLYAADEGWFGDHKITAHNIASNMNPLSSPQGLSEIARMVADGTITVRIDSNIVLGEAAQMLVKLRHRGFRGKTVIRL